MEKISMIEKLNCRALMEDIDVQNKIEHNWLIGKWNAEQK
jgi:hypothetical protein